MRERKTAGWIPFDNCLPFCSHFLFLSAVGLHENVYTNITHTLTLLHTLMVPGLTAHGKEYTLAFVKAWVNAHPWRMATDVAFTTENGWMHTHDIWPWMLPSLKVQQRLNKYTSSCQCKGVRGGGGGGHTWLKITIKSEIIAHKFELTNKGVHTNLNWRKRFMWKYWINEFYFSTARIHQINMVTLLS